MSKVAIVCGGGIVSGKEMMVLELADGLRASGYDIQVVTSFWSDGNFARRLKALDLPANPVWFGFISATLRLDCMYMTVHQMLRWPQLLLGYRRFLRRFAPEKVVHTNWHSLLTIFPFLKPQRDVYWVHELMPKKDQYRRLFRWLEHRLDCFVAVSNAVAKSLGELGIGSNKICVIHNGIADPVCGVVREGEPTETLNIGIVGQIGHWKGHEDLLDAFKLVAQHYPHAKLRIFGKGSAEYEQLLRDRARQLGIDHKLHWMGFVGERMAIYGNLTILAVPSRLQDPLPTSAIEAAFFGIPVVASRRGGLPEIVEDGATGLLFKSGNSDELARHLVTLLGNAELRERMGQNARRRAIALFSRERFVRQFCRLLSAGDLIEENEFEIKKVS
jgi:glycosyltransferase involved in cell wall biosynthesis